MRAAIAALLVFGCNPLDPYDPDLSESEFLCESECPPGFSCVAQPDGPSRCIADSGRSGEPSIRIVDPEDGDELDATKKFDLVVEIENFTLQPDLIADPVEGEGHWHWYLDGVHRGSLADLNTTVGPEEAGCHTISVDLRQNGHAELDPPKRDSVGVRLEDGGPTICIVSPPPGESFDEGEIGVTVDVRNFVLDETDEAGHGHWHVSLDGEQTDDHIWGPSTSVLVTAGEDRGITVELVSNGESPLDPPRAASVSVNVTPR